ncbi:MAG: carboxymuconolactone decarboxylase family protein [Proteobacteria bacterium]|nr:carboxymuconolactone decarboxylase family protein [Pseudomonadota bacterium]
MNPYKLIPYDDASPGVKAIYDEAMALMGIDFVPNWIQCMGSNENLLRANWEKVKGTLLIGDVPILLKELIIFSISIRRGSSYCTAAHAHSALQLDKTLKYEDLLEIVEGNQHSDLPVSFQSAVKVALKAALEPNAVGESDLAELVDDGFSDREIMEILAQADLAVMFNTITATANLAIDDQYHRNKPTC